MFPGILLANKYRNDISWLCVTVRVPLFMCADMYLNSWRFCWYKCKNASLCKGCSYKKYYLPTTYTNPTKITLSLPTLQPCTHTSITFPAAVSFLLRTNVLLLSERILCTLVEGHHGAVPSHSMHPPVFFIILYSQFLCWKSVMYVHGQQFKVKCLLACLLCL